MTTPSDAHPLPATPTPRKRLHPDILTTVAGASASLLGLIEGLADFSASSLNYLAGWLSDRGGKRKLFVLMGYGFSTLAKTILLVSSSIVGLSLFRVIERLGKGFCGPSRYAWLSAIATRLQALSGSGGDFCVGLFQPGLPAGACPRCGL